MPTFPSHYRRPFLLFAVLAANFLLGFGGWSAAVFCGTTIPAVDLELAESSVAHSREHPGLRLLMVVATSCGGVRANFLIALGGAFWMWRHHRRRFAFAWLVIACVGGLMDLGLKGVFGRERPPAEIRDAVIQLDNESYPSGHAMGSVVGYGMLGFVLLQRVKNLPRRFALGGLLTIWVALIGLSRVYLRAHWASDVVGGWLLGLGYMNACLSIYFWRSSVAGADSRGAATP